MPSRSFPAYLLAEERAFTDDASCVAVRISGRYAEVVKPCEGHASFGWACRWYRLKVGGKAEWKVVLDGQHGQWPLPQGIGRLRVQIVYVFRNSLIYNVTVELVGFEPTSAQGNHVLSTRLSQPLVFVRRQDLGHPPPPYPLSFHPWRGAAAGYSRFFLHRLASGFGTTSSERCLVAPSHGAIEPVTYYASVRQRERNCFRQLIFCPLRLRR